MHSEWATRVWQAACLACALVGIAAAPLKPATAAPGLDVRPANPACIARPIPVANALVRAVPAFPASFAPIAPVEMRQHPLDPTRYFVAERGGRIWTVYTGPAAPYAFAVSLDLTSRMRFTAPGNADSQQRGITSFVFHPLLWRGDFPYVFVTYNARPAPNAPVVSRLSRFRSNDFGVTFDPRSEVILLQRPQSAVWHHFGQLQIGPEGWLYLSAGEGADVLPDERANRAQNWLSLYGAIFRINPYLDKPEVGAGIDVVAKGLRNPWRISFDALTGELWASDVGEDSWEEINQIFWGGNYGWPFYEGPECRRPSCLPPTTYVQPAHYFDHSEGSAAIGGHVYRGAAIPALQGSYVFGSASHPRLWALQPGTRARIDIGQLPRGVPTGFFADHANELFVLDAITSGIWKLVPSGAGGEPPVEPFPPLLSQTGCVNPANPLVFAPGVIPFDVINPLWSDGAAKRRGLALPDGQGINLRPNGDFDLPPRTVLLKTFLLNDKPIETRLFVRHPNGGGWRGYTYEWIGGDAQLLTAGKAKVIDGQTWVYPSRTECMQCHNAASGASLSLEIAQLNRNFTYPATGRTGNQLETFQHIGLFENALPPPATWPRLATRIGGPIGWRARSYLHSNCAFCHRPGGGAQANIDLRYWVPFTATQTCNMPPLTTDLGVPGVSLITPGHPELSMLPIRMARRDVYGMPPLASLQLDLQMIATVNAWIGSLAGCTP